MAENSFIALVTIVVLGACAQWLAWATRLPSILLLLLSGFAAGPLTGWINPDDLFGDLLLPLVSLAVALILFEGGLTLRFSEIRGVGTVVGMLVTVGVFTTWVLAGAAAYLFLGLDFQLAALIGAILTVTGPTVVLPLLAQIKPTGRAAAVLKWEGIVIDPIGASLAVLVFELVALGALDSPASRVGISVARTVLIGGGLGLAGAGLLVISLRRFWVPDHLQAAVAMMVVVATFAGANTLQHESGLLAVTVMGIALANQRAADIRHVLEFKENLRVLLLSTVFILLSARIRLSDLASIGPGMIGFVAVLVLIVRPASVVLSSVHSKLTWRERVFVGCMAPRGIVAAAITSVFALQLEQRSLAQAGLLMPIMFMTIVGTVLLYGLTGGPIARALKLSDPNPQGVLLVGATPFVRQVGQTLQQLGFRVLLVDTNRRAVTEARMLGLAAHHGSILAEEAHENLDLSGIGRLLAMTSNDEVNVLARERFSRRFGRAHVFQLRPKETRESRAENRELFGRPLFGEEAGFQHLTELCEAGARVRATTMTEAFNFDDFKSQHGDGFLPLFLADGHRLQVLCAGDKLVPKAGQTLVTLMPAKIEDGAGPSSWQTPISMGPVR